jgi:hypothetical protein
MVISVRGYSRRMDHVIVRRLTLPFVAVLALGACTAAPDNRPGQTTTTATTTQSIQPACSDVLDKAQALLTTVGRFGTGKATEAEVRTAADELADSFESAKSELGPSAQASLDNAGRALQDVVGALTTQPVDTTRLRAAANQVVTALADAATVCTSGTSSPSITSSTSGTSGGTTDSTRPTESTGTTGSVTTTS